MEKIPCEVIVWYVLPVMRRGLAVELLKKDTMTQAKVAELVGVTPSAVSQYLKDKRAKDIADIIEDDKMQLLVQDAIATSAQKVLDEKSTVTREICGLCNLIRERGLLHYFHSDDITVDDCLVCDTCDK